MFLSCRKKLIFIIVVVVVVVCIVIALSVSLWWYFTQEKKEDKPDKPGKSNNPQSLGGPYWRQAVATDTNECSDIGNDTLARNGSAVDAAIAAMFCLGVINMHSSGVGGGGMMLVYIRKLKKAKVIDFRETAPAATTSDMFPPTESGKNMSKYGIYLVSCICVYLGIRLFARKFGKNRCPRLQNVHFRLTCIAQEKRPCLSSLLFSSRRPCHRCSWGSSRPIHSLEGIRLVTVERFGPTCH